MSPQDSNSSGKQSLLSKIDVYTVMLAVAFLAMVLACTLLTVEMGRYKWEIKANVTQPG